MRALMLDVPEELLRERRVRGLDLFDEMWEGVLHMNPPPSAQHQRFAKRLLMVLDPLADKNELICMYETGLFRADDSYRTPDLVVHTAEDASDRGVDHHAELVVEIRSPHDETYDKFEFYAACTVPELLVIEPTTREIELFTLVGDEYHVVQPDGDGTFRLRCVDLSLTRTEEPPGLLLEWPDGSKTI